METFCLFINAASNVCYINCIVGFLPAAAATQKNCTCTKEYFKILGCILAFFPKELEENICLFG